MDSIENMDEEQLPPNEAFYSMLTDSNILDKDYEHAQKVWDTFILGTMRAYHNLYMISMFQPFSAPIHNRASVVQ